VLISHISHLERDTFDGNLWLKFLPPRVQGRSFLELKTRYRMKGVMERAHDLLLVDEEVFQNHQHLHLALENGTLQLDNHTSPR
jgi:hypothetical protein